MFRIVRSSKLRELDNRVAAEQYKRLGADTTATLALDLLREWYETSINHRDRAVSSPALSARTAMLLGLGPKPQPGRVVRGVSKEEAALAANDREQEGSVEGLPPSDRP